MNSASSRTTNRGAPGLKALIAAGAFVATLGGWAAFAVKDRVPAAQPGGTPAPAFVGAATGQPLPALRVVSAPLPGSGVPNPVAVTQSSR
jgi:hypothetical protein